MAPREIGRWASILIAALLTPALASAGKYSLTCGSELPGLTPGIPCGLTLHSLGYTPFLDAPAEPQSIRVQESTNHENVGDNTGATEQHQALAQNEERQPGELSPPQDLPDAPSHSSHAPMRSSDKLDLFLQHISPTDIFLGVTFDAGWAQLTNDWPGYGQGMAGFGRRWGALLADREASTFFGSFLLPTLLHQDPRYFRLGAGQTMSHRIGYAMSRVVVARKDDGRNTFNSSLMLSTLLVKSLTNAYYPQQQRGFSPTMSRVGGSLLGSVQTSILREFQPDVVRILQKHAPEKLKQLERKLPFREHWSPTHITHGAVVWPRRIAIDEFPDKK
jgi:hypothetical protein